LKPNKSFFIDAGVNLNLPLSQKVASDVFDREDENRLFENPKPTGSFGLGYYFNKMSIGFRYQFPFNFEASFGELPNRETFKSNLETVSLQFTYSVSGSRPLD
jgi:hypothetical protein